ncbi:MAG: 5'-nucleotidase [Armatimonadota bacterium]|nr:5'-nucleotidase [Armatimonadota bacterium]
MRLITVIVAMTLVAAVVVAGTTAAELTTANAQRQETSFGDLTADALVHAAKTTIALVPAVSFKSGTIPAGEVTGDAVRKLLTKPGESWAVVALTGRQLRQTLERSVSRAPQPHAGFLQVSGVVLTYDPGKPRNSRIVSLTISGADLQPDGEYQVAMPLSLAKGGSGYFTIFREEDITRSGSEGLTDAILDFVDSQESVNYTGQGRINVAG